MFWHPSQDSNLHWHPTHHTSLAICTDTQYITRHQPFVLTSLVGQQFTLTPNPSYAISHLHWHPTHHTTSAICSDIPRTTAFYTDTQPIARHQSFALTPNISSDISHLFWYPWYDSNLQWHPIHRTSLAICTDTQHITQHQPFGLTSLVRQQFVLTSNPSHVISHLHWHPKHRTTLACGNDIPDDAICMHEHNPTTAGGNICLDSTVMFCSIRFFFGGDDITVVQGKVSSHKLQYPTVDQKSYNLSKVRSRVPKGVSPFSRVPWGGFLLACGEFWENVWPFIPRQRFLFFFFWSGD